MKNKIIIFCTIFLATSIVDIWAMDKQMPIIPVALRPKKQTPKMPRPFKMILPMAMDLCAPSLQTAVLIEASEASAFEVAAIYRNKRKFDAITASEDFSEEEVIESKAKRAKIDNFTYTCECGIELKNEVKRAYLVSVIRGHKLGSTCPFRIPKEQWPNYKETVAMPVLRKEYPLPGDARLKNDLLTGNCPYCNTLITSKTSRDQLFNNACQHFFKACKNKENKTICDFKRKFSISKTYRQI